MSEHMISLPLEQEEHLREEAVRRNVPPAHVNAWIEGLIQEVVASTLAPASLNSLTPPFEVQQQMDRLAEQIRERAQAAAAAGPAIGEQLPRMKRSLREFSGLGKGLWGGVDAQQYVSDSRADREVAL